jgi:hypothetical protein
MDDILQAVVERTTRERLARRVTQINATTRERIKDLTVQAVAEGTSPRELARVFRGLVDPLASDKVGNELARKLGSFGSELRAETIARTEMRVAQNAAQIDAFTGLGVRQVELLDGDDDPVCAARNGQIVSMEEAEQAMLAEHPNGTLTFAPAPLDRDPTLPPVPEFVPPPPSTLPMPISLSADEMGARLSRSFPNATMTNLRGIHPELRIEVTSVLEGLAARYPDAHVHTFTVKAMKTATAKVTAHTPILRDPVTKKLVDGPTRIEMELNSKVLKSPQALAVEQEAYEKAGDWTVWPEIKAQTQVSFLKNTLTHEWGHVIDFQRGAGSAGVASIPGTAVPSKYAQKNAAEAFAESFAQYEAGLRTPAAEAVRQRLSR